MDNQEAFRGEEFTLREPEDINRNIELKATRDGKTGQYHVALVMTSGSGPTLAEALHELASECEERKLYGSDNLSAFAIPKRTIRKCQYCDAEIWFAYTVNNRWMPLDADPVRARQLKYARRHVVTNDGRVNRVRSVGKNTNQGTVWIAHPDVCGLAPEEPDDVPLRERWEKNKIGAGIHTDSLLKEICNDITELDSRSNDDCE